MPRSFVSIVLFFAGLIAHGESLGCRHPPPPGGPAPASEPQLYMLPDQADTTPGASGSPTLVVWQVSCTLPCAFDVAFQPPTADGTAVFTGESLALTTRQRQGEFDERFEATFGLAARGYNVTEVSFARAALSNLLGGIGYFYGQSLYGPPPARPAA